MSASYDAMRLFSEDLGDADALPATRMVMAATMDQLHSMLELWSVF